jgi:hypothetical protein
MSTDQSSDPLPPGMGKPAVRALDLAGIQTLAEAAAHSEAELAALHGVGPKAIRILQQALTRRGMAMRDSRPGDPPT